MSGRMLSGVISTFRCRKPGLILCCYNLRQVHREQEQLELADFKDISSSKIYSSSCEWNDQHGCSQVCSCLISPSCLVSKPSATFFPHHFSRQPLHSCTYCFLCFLSLSFRWQSGKKKKSACQNSRCKRHGFDLWAEKTPWRREWQPIPVFFSWRIP